MPKSFFLALHLTALWPAALVAAPYTLSFSGAQLHVAGEYLNGNVPIPAGDQQFAPRFADGQTVNASVTYDTSQTDINPDPNTGTYRIGVLAVSIPELGLYATRQSSSMQISAFNNTANPDDQFYADGFGVDTFSSGAGLQKPWDFNLLIFGATNMLGDDRLPTNLLNWRFGNLGFWFLDSSGNNRYVLLTFSAIMVGGSVRESCAAAAVPSASVQIGSIATSTDSIGNYSIGGLSPGTYSVSVAKAGYAPYSGSVAVPVGGANVTADFSLSPLASVTGHVRNNCSGGTVAASSVQVGSIITSSDDGGAYALTGLAPGTYSVSVSKPGYASYSGSVSVPACSPNVAADFTLASRVSDILAGSVTFGKSTDPRYPYAMIGKFTPANGVTLQDAAEALCVQHFNWIQTVAPPAYWHVRLIASDHILPYATSPVPLPATDPAPVAGYGYVITSDLPGAHSEQWKVVCNPPGDGKGFYYNEGADASGHITDSGHSFIFKDAAVFPNTFLSGGDSVRFTTRLAGVRADGSYTFFGYSTGFTWNSDAVFDGAGATSGNAYGMYALKETDETAVPPVLSGAVFNVQEIGPSIEMVSKTNGTFVMTWRAMTGAVYQVQYNADVGSGVWSNLGGSVTATNSLISASDTTASGRSGSIGLCAYSSAKSVRRLTLPSLHRMGRGSLI